MKRKSQNERRAATKKIIREGDRYRNPWQQGFWLFKVRETTLKCNKLTAYWKLQIMQWDA